MKVYLLQDDDNHVDAVIIAEKSTKEKIQEAINNIKEKYPNSYEWDDIVKALPSDCKIYDRWNNETETIYY